MLLFEKYVIGQNSSPCEEHEHRAKNPPAHIKQECTIDQKEHQPNQD